MLNLYDAVRGNPGYSKLVIGEFLFAEYTCGTNQQFVPNWSEKDYFVHIVTGRKTWHTPDGVWQARPGDTLFFKKGATIVEQHFDAEVCLLMVFIPDALLRGTVREVTADLGAGGLQAQRRVKSPGRSTGQEAAGAGVSGCSKFHLVDRDPGL